MQDLKGPLEYEVYSLEEIEDFINEGSFPFSGITKLGSARFDFLKPSFYAGIAVHAGSRVRDDLRDGMLVSVADRYREEDPGTDQFLNGFPIKVTALDSRFEYDLNRPEENAITKSDETAWGLKVWKRVLNDEEREKTLEKYREFQQLLDLLSDYLVKQSKKAYIFDFHSYCYQRARCVNWHLNKKPEINIGTRAINKKVFGKDTDFLIDELSTIKVEKRKLRVAENEVFGGGYIAKKLCARHYDNLAVFALEFKKIFMDERTGEFYDDLFDELKNGLSRSLKKFFLEETEND